MGSTCWGGVGQHMQNEEFNVLFELLYIEVESAAVLSSRAVSLQSGK